MPYKGQNPIAVRAAGVDTFRAVHPALEDFVDRGVEVFNAAADLGCEGTGEDRRQSQSHAGSGGNDGDGVRCAGFQLGFLGQQGWKALFPARRVRNLLSLSELFSVIPSTLFGVFFEY